MMIKVTYGEDSEMRFVCNGLQMYNVFFKYRKSVGYLYSHNQSAHLAFVKGL